jgi:hypothetical protein
MLTISKNDESKALVQTKRKNDKKALTTPVPMGWDFFPRKIPADGKMLGKTII